MDSSNPLSMGRTDHSEISPPRRWPERVPETALPLARASAHHATPGGSRFPPALSLRNEMIGVGRDQGPGPLQVRADGIRGGSVPRAAFDARVANSRS